jgi:hypothetical protein
MQAHYIFPETADRMIAALGEHAERDDYVKSMHPKRSRPL